MTTVLLSNGADGASVTVEHAGALTRLRAFVQASRLDRELAAGASPDSSAALSLRAQELIGARARLKLVSYIHRLVDETRQPVVPLAPGLPIRWDAVLASRKTLLLLAERLISHRPVDPRGVAHASVLLGASDGPLYNGGTDHLEVALQGAIAALEPDAWTARVGE
jgi:hypothetical protein